MFLKKQNNIEIIKNLNSACFLPLYFIGSSFYLVHKFPIEYVFAFQQMITLFFLFRHCNFPSLSESCIALSCSFPSLND